MARRFFESTAGSPQRKTARKLAFPSCVSRTEILVRLAGIEPTTPWFVAKYSIQLSYSREALHHSKLERNWPINPERVRRSIDEGRLAFVIAAAALVAFQAGDEYQA